MHLRRQKSSDQKHKNVFFVDIFHEIVRYAQCVLGYMSDSYIWARQTLRHLPLASFPSM